MKVIDTTLCDVCGWYVRSRDVLEASGGCVCSHCLTDAARVGLAANRDRFAYHRLEEGQIVASSNRAKRGYIPRLEALIRIALDTGRQVA